MSTVTLWMQMSLDGYAAGPGGALDWPIVDKELHTFFVDQLRDADTFLYGRKVYEGMAAFWPTADQDPSATEMQVAYSTLWKPMPKVVFSRTLRRADWNARVVGDDIPGEIARLKQRPDTNHVLFGGPDIVAEFLRYDLIDEFRLFVHPVVLGDGTALLRTGERRPLTLVEARTFDSAVVHVHYRRTAAQT
jgi:dihydrofolate reductase